MKYFGIFEHYLLNTPTAMKEFEHQKLRELPNNFPAEIAKNDQDYNVREAARKRLDELK